MKISVIIPTLGRVDEVVSAVLSVDRQAYKKVEMIIIDQNSHSELCEKINCLDCETDIHHFKVPFRGASKARNFGVSKASGELVFFMDDDAELFKETLICALRTLNKENSDVVFGRCVDRAGDKSVLDFREYPGALTINNHENMFVESTMLAKTDVMLNYPFDETLGVGNFHGAEEAYDVVIRMLKRGVSLFYDPSISVFHPQIDLTYQDKGIRRVFTYRCGFARICQKHSLHRKYYSRCIKVALYIPYCFFFKRNRFRYYIAEMLGLVAGRIIP